MVKKATVNSILNNLRGYRQKLDQLAGVEEEAFLKDFTQVESAKHLLQVSVQSCLDLAHHVIASEGYRTPQDSYDAFAVLNEEGIIPDDFMSVLRQMVSFRNRVVHLYWDVDDKTVYGILQKNLVDFDAFIRHILDFLESEGN